MCARYTQLPAEDRYEIDCAPNLGKLTYSWGVGGWYQPAAVELHVSPPMPKSVRLTLGCQSLYYSTFYSHFIWTYYVIILLIVLRIYYIFMIRFCRFLQEFLLSQPDHPVQPEHHGEAGAGGLYPGGRWEPRVH